MANSVASFKASLEYTHTKKTRGIYRPQNRNSRALRKIWMKSKLLWVFRKIKKIEYLENQSGRNYSRVSGIQESAGGTCEVVESKVRDQGYG